jgi:hypothetical protein
MLFRAWPRFLQHPTVAARITEVCNDPWQLFDVDIVWSFGMVTVHSRSEKSNRSFDSKCG